MSRSSWLKWCLCSDSVGAGDAGGMEVQHGGRKEPLGQEKIFYIRGDSALLGDYKGFNWRMKESKVVSDISGLGIWQSAAWSPAKSLGLARKC